MKFKRKGGSIMKDLGIKLYIRMRNLVDDNGQDLIEYALVVALIAFAATAGMSTLATKLNQAFANIGSTLTTYTS
jgi:pilus assembly protein Flp/PilA